MAKSKLNDKWAKEGNQIRITTTFGIGRLVFGLPFVLPALFPFLLAFVPISFVPALSILSISGVPDRPAIIHFPPFGMDYILFAYFRGLRQCPHGGT